MSEEQLFGTKAIEICSALNLIYGSESEKYPFVKVQYEPTATYTLLSPHNDIENTYQNEDGIIVKVKQSFEVPDTHVGLFKYNYDSNEPSTWLIEHEPEQETSTILGYAGYCGKLAVGNTSDVIMVSCQIHDLDAGAKFIPVDSVKKIELLMNDAMRVFMIDTEEHFKSYYKPLVINYDGVIVVKQKLSYEEIENARRMITEESVQEYETVYIKA